MSGPHGNAGQAAFNKRKTISGIPSIDEKTSVAAA
jgi:hypothetical protein